MKIKTKLIYYCDFCKKHLLTINSMKIHELHCTCNPNRKCRMCDLMGETSSLDLPGVVEKYNKLFQKHPNCDSYFLTDDISRQLVSESDCPICILALKQQLTHKIYIPPEIWNFQEVMKDAFEIINTSR